MNKSYTSILNSTIGVIFLGTPHHGSGLASIGDVAARIGEAVLPSSVWHSNRPLLGSLRKNCDGLFEKASEFMNVSEKIKIYSFFETITIGGRLVRLDLIYRFIA
jgi:hypothetical protein